jgi:RNA polymerase sigma-70 factor (ECF subfamily)
VSPRTSQASVTAFSNTVTTQIDALFLASIEEQLATNAPPHIYLWLPVAHGSELDLVQSIVHTDFACRAAAGDWPGRRRQRRGLALACLAMSLASAWRATAKVAHGTLADAELESILARLVERGRERWPQLQLAPDLLSREIGARAQTCEALSSLCAEDLHLAVACAHGVRGAHEAYEEECLGARSVRAAIRRIDPSPAFGDEVRQVLRERLFVPAPGHIAEYSGRGALASWTRVTAVRLALRLRRRRHDAGEQSGVEKAADEKAAAVDPELRLLKQRYGAQFQEALAASFERLDDEQHNLLRLQLVEGLGTGQIAALFGLDRSTIKRRLAACRETLLSQTQAMLRERLGLSPDSFRSLARLLASQLDLSVQRLLRQRPSPE